MNIEGVTLHLLLEEPDKEKALKYYSELSPSYFSNTFKSVLTAIQQFYEDKDHIPNMEELSLYRNRSNKITSAISSIKLIPYDNITLELAVEELSNQYAQNFTLEMFDTFLDHLPLLNREDILEKLGEMPLKLEEEVITSGVVHTAKSISLFKTDEVVLSNKIESGICEEWDRDAGYYRQELALFGGKKGSGKSIFCANLCANQHKLGKVSLYFTIEMTAEEIYQRIIGILSGVSPNKIKNNKLDPAEKRKVATVICNMFIDGDIVFNKFFDDTTDPNLLEMQEYLQKHCDEKVEGRIIIIDDRNLSLPTIDTQISFFRAKYGDLLTIAAIDYINQIVIPGQEGDVYDWKAQIVVCKTLKNFARKNNIWIASPYQMDDNGVARFSKGLLDAPDTAQLLQVEDKESGVLTIKTSKARSNDDTGIYAVGIDWDTLKIDPKEVVSLESLEDVSGDDKDELVGKAW